MCPDFHAQTKTLLPRIWSHTRMTNSVKNTRKRFVTHLDWQDFRWWEACFGSHEYSEVMTRGKSGWWSGQDWDAMPQYRKIIAATLAGTCGVRPEHKRQPRASILLAGAGSITCPVEIEDCLEHGR